VQFIESSISGVRAAYLRLSAGPASAEVCLLPMVHVGAPSYYAAVKAKLDACDVVLFEGVRTFHSWLLTRSYAIATHRKRLGLVLQRDALQTASLKPNRIHADVSSAEFTAAWRDIPLFQRVAILLAAPAYGLWIYCTATRESIGRGLSTDEVESSKDLDRFEGRPEFETALKTLRDARLVEDLTSALAKHGTGARIGVLYGAAHMRAVSRFLTAQHRYRVVESEWIKVFDYE
jgi:hypothetical protein